MMLEINLTLNSKMLFLFKDLLENIRKKKYTLFAFYEFKKPKINLEVKINPKTGINHWVGTGIGPEIWQVFSFGLNPKRQ